MPCRNLAIDEQPGSTHTLVVALYMKNAKIKKQWKKPELKIVQLCCEATAYVVEAD